MSISMDKSVLLHNNIPSLELMNLSRVIPYKMLPITTGFKYLGFFIEPLGYRSKDWNWLVQKFENKISLWTHKLLSLGGRLILVQSVLSSIPVYWMGIAPIPVSILHKLRSITFAFLWGSSGNIRKFHLVCWSDLSWPKKFEGWGIKNLQCFSIALRLRNFCKVLFSDSLWHRVLTTKYLKQSSVVSWLREKNFSTCGVSAIWRGFIQTIPWMGCHLTWRGGMAMIS